MAYWCGKFMHLVAVVLAVTAFTFVMLDLLPVSIAHEVAGSGATGADLVAVRKELGLDAPVAVRYGRWLTGMLHGELGTSLSTRQPVGAALRAHLPVTLELLALTQIFTLVLAVPVGIVSACLLYTSDAADELDGGVLGGGRGS
jgi:peptide/nickel transport system permease protein